MKKKPRNFTIACLTVTVTLVTIVVFLNWMSLLEIYWISQVDNPEKRITATKKLAELKTHRAIPVIVQEFAEILIEDEAKKIYIHRYIDANTLYSFSPESKGVPIELHLHPMLYAIYTMGSEGELYLKEMIKGYMKDEIAKLQSQKNTSAANRLASLIQAMVHMTEVWKNENRYKVAEGPENWKKRKKREPFR